MFFVYIYSIHILPEAYIYICVVIDEDIHDLLLGDSHYGIDLGSFERHLNPDVY